MLCPESLIFSHLIVFNNSICCIKDVLGRTIVFLKFYDFCFRIGVFKIQYVFDVCTTKFVDGLIIITYHTKIVQCLTVITFCAGKKMYKSKLCCVCVLIFINHYVLKSVLVIFKYIRVFFKKLYRFTDKVIKIECIGIVKPSFIFSVCSCIKFFLVVAHRHFFVFLR